MAAVVAAAAFRVLPISMASLIGVVALLLTGCLRFEGLGRGISAEVVQKQKPEAFIMHPGPMNRDVEIASEVADGPRQVILDQVANGVAVRMAVLYLLAGGGDDETAA